MTNPFLVVEQEACRSNPNYVRYSKKGHALFSGITLGQRVRIGVLGIPTISEYRVIEGQLDDLTYFSCVVGGEEIGTAKINRVELLEARNPFM